MIPGRLTGAAGLRYELTNTEHDAGIEARARASEERDLPTGADLEAEAEWWRGFKDRTDEVDPHGWPVEAHGRLLEALARAEALVATLCDAELADGPLHCTRDAGHAGRGEGGHVFVSAWLADGHDASEGRAEQ